MFHNWLLAMFFFAIYTRKNKQKVLILFYAITDFLKSTELSSYQSLFKLPIYDYSSMESDHV